MLAPSGITRALRLPRGSAPWILALTAVGAGVHASPAASLYRDGPGARAMALGGSATAVADDPLDALFTNPAALGEVHRPTITLNAQGASLDGEFHNRANRRASLDNLGALGAGAVTFPLGPVRFALGINPDIASRADWRYRMRPGARTEGPRMAFGPTSRRSCCCARPRA